LIELDVALRSVPNCSRYAIFSMARCADDA
jgi:hypothetical protein